MIPLLRPNPVSLRSLGPELQRIEDSGVFTNFGPTNTFFEHELSERLFEGGGCVTVCNATIGLMLAIRAALPDPGSAVTALAHDGPRYALMPSFTFAAAAQAALWNGLVPLFCDSNEADWSADPAAEEAMIAAYGSRIAVILPYATLGAHIDLARYEALSLRTGIPVVVDAAASLGSLGPDGKQFGAGSPLPVVFSMHATKAFSTAEGGVIHSTDPRLVARIRCMANFGFEQPRTASLFGLNAKLSEVHAALAVARLADFEDIMLRRQELAEQYRDLMPGWEFQRDAGTRCGGSVMSVLLPHGPHPDRDGVIGALRERGIGAASYFSPHVARQPYFASCPADALVVADDVSARVMSLPIWDGLGRNGVRRVCDELHRLVDHPPRRNRAMLEPAS